MTSLPPLPPSPWRESSKMSNETTKNVDMTEIPEKLPDGTYEPVLTKKDLRRVARRWNINISTYSYTYQEACSVVYATWPALQKIYRGDEEGLKNSLEYAYRYFNVTPPVAGLLLGAGLAIEDQRHNDGLAAEQDLKVGLMGSLSGVADTIIWVLIPTILGSISAYMAQNGNIFGMIAFALYGIVFLAWRIYSFWGYGYDLGTQLISKLADKISVFTESVSVLGLMVVGALIPSVVKITCGLNFQMGDVSMSVQEGVLDAILPSLLPIVATAICYTLLKKRVSMNLIIIGIIVVSLLGAVTGVLVVPA